MRISCVIPVRNRPEMVLEAIESVYSQDQPVHEIVVVDDGSTDSTAAAVAARFPDVRLLHLSGLGPGAARNAGVLAAQAEVVMFLDSDDLWLPGHVAALSTELDKGVPLAYGTTRTMDSISGGEFLIPENGQGRTGNCFPGLLKWCFLVPSAVAVDRASFLIEGGFRSGDLAEDWDFFLRFGARHHFGFSGAIPISLRRLHRQSLCGAADAETLLSAVRRLQNTVTALQNPEDPAFNGFIDMEQFILVEDRQWTTVQEWYTAMRDKGLIERP